MSFGFDSLTGADQYIYGHNDKDNAGNPTGGYAHAGPANRPKCLDLYWQDGPMNREAGEKPNGMMVEDVLELCRIRLEFFQDSRFACDENAEAIGHIQSALKALDRRRQDRRQRGVEGKNEV